MQFQLGRLRHRRATVDGGEDYRAYFCTSPHPSTFLMRVINRKSSLSLSPHSGKGSFLKYSNHKVVNAVKRRNFQTGYFAVVVTADVKQRVLL